MHGVISSFEDEIYTIGYVPQLHWNWRAYNWIRFFSHILNHPWNWNFLEVATILVPNVCLNNLYAWRVISSFEDEICTIGYVPQLHWNWRDYNRICFFSPKILNHLWNWNLLEVATILVPKVCPNSLYAWRVMSS